MYQQLWANMNQHGHMQKVGQKVILAAIFVWELLGSGAATPLTSFSITVLMEKLVNRGPPWLLALEHLSCEERLDIQPGKGTALEEIMKKIEIGSL